MLSYENRDVVVPAASGTKIFNDDHSDEEEADNCLGEVMGCCLGIALPCSHTGSPLPLLPWTFNVMAFPLLGVSLPLSLPRPPAACLSCSWISLLEVASLEPAIIWWQQEEKLKPQDPGSQ